MPPIKYSILSKEANWGSLLIIGNLPFSITQCFQNVSIPFSPPASSASLHLKVCSHPLHHSLKYTSLTLMPMSNIFRLGVSKAKGINGIGSVILEFLCSRSLQTYSSLVFPHSQTVLFPGSGTLTIPFPYSYMEKNSVLINYKPIL